MLDQISSTAAPCYDCERTASPRGTRIEAHAANRDATVSSFSARIEIDVVRLSGTGSAEATARTAEPLAAPPTNLRGAFKELVKAVRKEVRELLRDESLDKATKQEMLESFRDFRREVRAAFNDFRHDTRTEGAGETLDAAVLEGFWRFKQALRSSLSTLASGPGTEPTPALASTQTSDSAVARASAGSTAPATDSPAGPLAQPANVEPPSQATIPAASEDVASPDTGTAPTSSSTGDTNLLDEKIHDLVAAFERSYNAFEAKLSTLVESVRPSELPGVAADPLPGDSPVEPTAPSSESMSASADLVYTRTSISVVFTTSSFKWAA